MHHETCQKLCFIVFLLSEMNIIQKNKLFLTATLGGIIALFLPMAFPNIVLADPVSTSVKCQDGKSVDAAKGMKNDKSVLDEKDFEYACRNHKGYAKPGGVAACKDSSVQNVYKFLANPKNKLNNKDYQEACKGHGGLQPNNGGENPEPPETTEPPEIEEIEIVPCKVDTSIITPDCSNGDNPIWGLLLLVVNIMTAGIGIVAVGGIIYGAILWTTAEDKNAQIVKAKEVIFNVVLGLVGYALLYAFIQFLIPGGVF